MQWKLPTMRTHEPSNKATAVVEASHLKEGVN